MKFKRNGKTYKSVHVNCDICDLKDECNQLTENYIHTFCKTVGIMNLSLSHGFKETFLSKVVGCGKRFFCLGKLILGDRK